MFPAYSTGRQADSSRERDLPSSKQESTSLDNWLSNSSFPPSSNACPESKASLPSTSSSTQHNAVDFGEVCAQGIDEGSLDSLGSKHCVSSSGESKSSPSPTLSRKKLRSRSRSGSPGRSNENKNSNTKGENRYKSKRHKRDGSRKRDKSQFKEKHSRRDRTRRRNSCSRDRSQCRGTQPTESIRPRQEPILVSSDTFYEDRKRDLGNLKVLTLSRPSVALYHTLKKTLGSIKYESKLLSRKKVLKNRYYNKIVKYLEKELENSDSKQADKSASEENPKSVITDLKHVEEELSKTTAKYNRDLSSEPQNVTLWLKYVEFQDIVHQFELTHRRGGGASGRRVTAERKLSILDKALEKNPGNLDLLKERCQLAETVLSSDKLSTQLRNWVTKDPGNVVLWKSLIMASQGSLSSCRVPVVKTLYQKALASVHGLRRGSPDSVAVLESKMIDLILHFGLFLRQAGLMELMWYLFNVYLEFNLAKLDSSKFNISSTIADNALIELEETILESQMPLPTLWLRVETLRSGTHWVSLPADSDCEDPQRIIFPEDVNDFIHPICTPQLCFRLVTVTLTLLKVPLLPWRESAAEAAGLHPLPWLYDGPEPLYASLLTLGTLEFRETSVLLSDAAQLAHGPQYLVARPGQNEYIDFLTQVFSACSKCLPSSHSTFILVWWLRFYRWLIQLDRLGHCKLTSNRKKKLRTTAKELLRQDCNRSNLLLFKEFALLEWECGSEQGAIKVLQGAISAQPSSKPVPFSNERSTLCTLYRTYVELCLSFTHIDDQKVVEGNSKVERIITEEDREKATSLLVSLGRGTPLTGKKVQSTDIAAALSKFDHISRELFVKPQECELDLPLTADSCHVAPSFIAEWTACYGWLLYLSDSVWKASTAFEFALSRLQVPESEAAGTDKERDCGDSASSLVKVQREAVYEGYVSLLRHYCHQTRVSFGVLREVLLRGLKEFPANFTLLAAFADFESAISGTGMPSWRLSKVFMEFNSAAASALLVFVMRHRLKQQQALARNADLILNRGGPEIPNSFLRTRMDTVLKRLTKHPVMRRCPLLWRLRLQFAAAFSNKDTDCHSTFYLALEDCPWSKALYMDIVQVLPMQLGQVQDLLIEKELRLHVTPEELEILRKDT